ncbi:MAG: ZIP family metal transporter [Firmicutes bacterium]|nr:ZIP family metal transporter [Bacillota bacterium]
MFQYFSELSPVLQALIATTITWILTAIGALPVLFFARVKKQMLDALSGFAAGVMTAASFWSLLLPATEHAEEIGIAPAPIIAVGFMCGGILLWVGDKLWERLEGKRSAEASPGAEISKKSTSRRRSAMLVFAITLHNFPEGLAIGVAFGALSYGATDAALTAAIMLAVGIGIQNMPEGMAVSLPLLREGMSGKRAFFFGQLSGLAEPIAGVLGALLVMKIRLLLPFMLSLAAGAMIFVVADELLPEANREPRGKTVTIATLLGFAVMMFLDMALS